jgi:acyl-CoA synthetase (AMP-forming)/AMP-acid ligase II
LAGAVPVPLYPPMRLGRLAEYHRRTAAMLAAAGARWVVSDRRLARLLGETVAGGALRLEVVVADRLLAEGNGAEAAPAPGRADEARADDLALVQFSSGTTVDPKPVALSHRAVLAQVEMLNAHWRDLPGATGVSWLPLYHDMGLIGCVFPAAALGAELTLIPPEVFIGRPAIWLRTLARHRGVVSAAPNFAYALCADTVRDEELEGVDLSSWRVALDGAETVAPAVLRRFGERFARWGFRPEALSPVYGLSEAALAVTFPDLAEPFVSGRFGRAALADGRAEPDPDGIELASVGRPLPGCRVEPRDGDGRALPEGRVGRLWIQSPSLMSGYLGRPEATAEVLRDGWLDTGDLGFLRRGELFLTGRAKDLVILRGRNYLPEDLEQALADLPGARAGGVAALSHQREGGAGEELLLFVETSGDGQAEMAALAAACRARLLERADLAADEVLLVEPGTLPRTSSGKIRRRETLARHLAGTLAPPDRVTSWRRSEAMAGSQPVLERRGGDDA